MKKIFSAVFTTFLFSSFGWSQYGVYHEPTCNSVDGSSVDISGGVYTENNVPVGGNTEVKLYFKNMSGSTKIISVKRQKLNVPSVWTGTLCWGVCDPHDTLFEGGCYGDAQMPTNPWMTPPLTVVNDSVAELKNHFNIVDTEGGGLFRYYFISGNTTLDSIDIHINATAVLSELASDAFGLSVYPNPASSKIMLNTTDLTSEYSVIVTDLLGKSVFTSEVDAVKEIDVSNFENGVYLITVAEKGKVIQTRRVVVKH